MCVYKCWLRCECAGMHSFPLAAFPCYSSVSRVWLYHVPFCWYRFYCCCCCCWLLLAVAAVCCHSHSLHPYSLHPYSLWMVCTEHERHVYIVVPRHPFDNRNCKSLCIKYLCRRYDSVSLEWSADSDGRHLRKIRTHFERTKNFTLKNNFNITYANHFYVWWYQTLNMILIWLIFSFIILIT